MPIHMKKFLSKHAPLLLTLVFGLMVFRFWGFRFPFALTYQEQLQLFLFDSDYFVDRIAEPGGLARYVAEFLVQFYNGVAIGAIILAVLYMLVQRLTWRVMRSESHYNLSFIPVVMLWFAMGDESVMLTYVIALVMALAVAWGWQSWIAKCASWVKWLSVLLMIPVMYWLIGPMVLLVAVLMSPWTLSVAGVVYSMALILLSAHFLPFPMMRVVLGISYYRIPLTLPYLLAAIPVVICLMAYVVRRLPKAKQWVNLVEVLVVLGVMAQFVDLGFDKKKYELIAYDHLVRVGDWEGVIDRAEQHMPDLPMSVSATNLALAMTNQLGERAFDFYQHGKEGLLPPFERNFATTQLTGEIFFHLGLVNTAQRLAFEAMEAIPNYNKSARVVKRLAETNLINGQYKVARKYLQMLEKTVFYRPWAQRTMALLGDEKAINAHPLYGMLRQYRLQEDFLFSDRELDKICGLLFMHNNDNQLAAQYLAMIPLMEKDLGKFMQFIPVIQKRVQYNPRHCQEALALAFMQRRQQPPQGLVSELTLQQMNDFARIYSADRSSSELAKYRNTVWYYMMEGK